MSRIPEMRFDGFTEPWEQRKLGGILTERNVQHPQSKEFPLVSFTVENGVTPKTERYEREQLVRGDKSIKKYKETRLNDIVYNPANLKFGAIARNKLGNAVFSPIYVTFDVNEIATPSFVEKLVTRNEFVQRALQYQQGTVYERMSVNPEDLCDLNVKIPSLEEQSKIGSFLDLIDNLITLHQRKYDRLKNLKKAYLEKMFPKNGEAVPEMRFEGFTEPWEQRKLGELLEFHNGFNGSSEKYGRGIPLISVMDILSNDFITSENIRIKADLTEKEFQRFKVGYGDVLFQRSSENVEDAGTSNVYLDERKCAVFGGFVICGKKKAEYIPLFLKYGLTNKAVRAQITSKAQGAQHINVSQDTLQGTVILLPSQYEQEKIGNYFRSIDALITLHQHKLERLKHLKQAYLQKMFA